MVVAETRRYSPAEYLKQEEQAELRSELIEGERVLMAGASANHDRLALNFCRLCPLEIGSQGYEVLMSDMRVWLPQYESYTYPDVLVVSGEPQFTDQTQKALTNPCLIVEVLSDSTGGMTRRQSLSCIVRFLNCWNIFWWIRRRIAWSNIRRWMITSGC